jgi:solute carrier family 12 (sodium/potassium/chloride transporter), member 2
MSRESGYQFGTFKGVFTPSLLTILGVIMYLRLPWVVGSVGLAATLLIVSISVSITLLTGLSISAMATNMRVGGGGAYYMISRTLGLEVGAAIGLPLFLAQALGIAFYIAGFSEIVVSYFPAFAARDVGVATLLALTLLAYFSANLALKSQFIVLVILIASLISFFAGGPPGAGEPLGEALPAASFWLTFAVFFPAVTGIEAGLGMSGDLRNPARSLPLGTLLAVLTGYLVYLAIPVFVASSVSDRSELLADTLIIIRIAAWPPLIIAGILGATLSSAMGALLAAPRTLQSLAQDAVLPRMLGRGYGDGNDPRLATVFAFTIALVGVLLGDINAIAPVLSMFFLTSYAVLNLSAGVEALIAGPAWRPTFRVPWWVSILGFVCCVAAMLMIDAGATFVALLIAGLVYHAVQRRQLKARWGDVRYGVLVLIARASLDALSRRQPNARSWNPNVLVLAGSPRSRWHLIVVGRALAGPNGLLTVASVVPEPSSGSAADTQRAIESHLEGERIPALVKVIADRDVANGMLSLVKSYGFGPLMPNTILLGRAATPKDRLKHAELLTVVQQRRGNLIILHEAESLPSLRDARRIDLWWRGHAENFGLMLALAFLMQQDEVWSTAEIVLWRIVDRQEAVEGVRSELAVALAEVRFLARIEVVVGADAPTEVIRTHSAGADMLFLGLRSRAGDESLDAYADYYRNTIASTAGLPPTLLLNAGEQVDLRRLFSSR